MYFKWILAVLGFAYFNNISGAIIGFIIGALIDSLSTKNAQNTKASPVNNLNSFIKNLTILTAAVMKADGSVVKGELEYVKSFFRQQFGDDVTKQALLYLRDILKQQIPITQAAIYIRTTIDYSTRIHVLHYLFGLAQSEGCINNNELTIIEYIAQNLGIAQADFLAVKSAFMKAPRTAQDVHWAYKVLEIQPNATNDEIKKAYKRMAIKYHPDKVSHHGDVHQKEAEEHFKKINNAYEEIKRQRGMN